MRVILQRVAAANVTIKSKKVAKINKGLLILVGIENEDSQEDINWLAKKVINLRIFSDEKGLMNNSIKDVSGDIIIVSQFTLYASTKKGNRPSYLKSARPIVAIPLYEKFVQQVENEFGKTVQTGEFGAEMEVELINDGPVTISIDSKNKE